METGTRSREQESTIDEVCFDPQNAGRGSEGQITASE